MCHLFSFVLYFTYILLFTRKAYSQVTFIQPPPAGPSHNYQDNPAYKYGSTITVQWTGDIPKDVDSLRLEARKDLINPKSDDVGYYLGAENLSASAKGGSLPIDMLVWQYSEYGNVPLYFVVLDEKTLDILGQSHYFNISQGPSTSSATSTSSKPRETSTATSTLTASNTGAVVGGTPPSSTNPATPTASSTATSQSAQKLPKKAIAGISVGAIIGGILVLVVLGFLARKHRIWSNDIFHNIFRRGQQSAAPQNNMAELPVDNPAELPVENSAELSISQEIKGSRVWVHPRGSGGLYEVP